jgi:hypothetical protein
MLKNSGINFYYCQTLLDNMDIENYLNRLEDLAEEYYLFQISPQDFLDQKRMADPSLRELFFFQKDFFGIKERSIVQGYYLEFSTAFENEDLEDRKVWFYLSHEIGKRRDKLYFMRKCAPYDLEQPLFKMSPDLWNATLNRDLININSVKLIGQGAILGFKNGYSLTDSELNPNILTWASTNFPSSPTYVRIHPYKVSVDLPIQPLLEATIIPANPKWWENLMIFKNNKEGSSYILEEGSTNTDHIWDYGAKKIRRLEVSAQRKNDGTLSMMIEELQKLSDGHWMGRCIHLDTKSAVGMPSAKAVLMHLDLAINMYFDETIKERWNQNLASGGKVVDATCRTHLFRIEEVPFDSVLEFARMFFKSSVLLSEWYADQFNLYPEKA